MSVCFIFLQFTLYKCIYIIYKLINLKCHILYESEAIVSFSFCLSCSSHTYIHIYTHICAKSLSKMVWKTLHLSISSVRLGTCLILDYFLALVNICGQLYGQTNEQKLAMKFCISMWFLKLYLSLIPWTSYIICWAQDKMKIWGPC